MNVTIINSAGGEPAEDLLEEKRAALHGAGFCVVTLYRLVHDAEHALSCIPGYLEQVLDGELWREALVKHLGRVYRHDTFREFVGALTGGLGTSLDSLRRLCRDHPDVLTKLEAQVERERS